MDSVAPATDQLLHRIATADDRRAFEQFFSRYYSRLLKFATLHVHSRELAEEIVSDVFVKIWQRRTALLDIKSMDSYLYTAIRNQSLNYLQKSDSQHTLSLDEATVPLQVDGGSPERTLLLSELQGEISHAVDRLPPQCKIIFKLIREDGLKYKEVAEILGISTKTIEVQIGIAIKKLTAALQGHLAGQRNTGSSRTALRIGLPLLAAVLLAAGQG